MLTTASDGAALPTAQAGSDTVSGSATRQTEGWQDVVRTVDAAESEPPAKWTLERERVGELPAPRISGRAVCVAPRLHPERHAGA